MLVQIVTENGQKKVIPLTADAGAGAPVGFIAPFYKKGNYSGWLYLDGSTFDETKYPLLYAYLGSNVLPDYREFALVGAEENTTDVYNASTNPTGTIHAHDVYTEGQAKDDQLQSHTHNIQNVEINWTGGGNKVASNQGGTTLVTQSNTGRSGTVTRGKRKAVYFYIKATSGLSENAQDNVVAQLNEERSYSTEEVNTGKKWIDGKPIYRKVWTGLSFGDVSNTWTDTGATLSNLDQLITCVGKRNDVVINIMNFQVNSNKLMYWTNAGYANPVTAIIAEYTKTTD